LVLARERLERAAPVEREPLDRELPDREPVDRDPLLERVPLLDREPLVEREPLDRELLDREDERLVVRPEELELRELLVRLVVRLRLVVARWLAGISARASSLTSRVSSAPRNFAIRSSSRRIDLASWAVSLSPTVSASVRMREYSAISTCSSRSSSCALRRWVSGWLVTAARAAPTWPFTAATALPATSPTASGTPGRLGPVVGDPPPSCLIRAATRRL
jgi:hypothetical protein